MVRVVQVFKDYEPPVMGGIEHTMRLLSRGLIRTGEYDVSVLCSSKERVDRVELVEGATVVRAATFGSIGKAPISPGFPMWIRKLRPDVLHLHYPNPTGEMSCLLAAPKCPVVLTYHADVVRQKSLMKLYRPSLKHFLKRVDRILVTTPMALEGNSLLEPHLDRCSVVPSGISFDRLEESDRNRAVAESLKRKFVGPRILFVGRLRPYKGLSVLIEAMGEIPGHLFIVGRGEEEARIREQLRGVAHADRVILAGDIPDEDLAGYYRAADVFVLPSIARNEAFGLAMTEAMYCGVPVVSTRLGTGTSYVNRSGETGLEVEPGSPAQIAKAVQSLLADPLRAKAMGQAGARRALQLGESSMVENTTAVYQQVVRDWHSTMSQRVS